MLKTLSKLDQSFSLSGGEFFCWENCFFFKEKGKTVFSSRICLVRVSRPLELSLYFLPLLRLRSPTGAVKEMNYLKLYLKKETDHYDLLSFFIQFFTVSERARRDFCWLVLWNFQILRTLPAYRWHIMANTDLNEILFADLIPIYWFE